jgi:ABC-2 type transport system ATP-binding protein
MPFHAAPNLLERSRIMPVVEVENLSKTYRSAVKQPGVLGTLRHFVRREYRDVHAVRSIDLRIEPGEIVGFLGANGAGKTTTLKMLTGLIYPTSGRVLVTGHVPFERRREFLRRITLVMGQKQQLMWDLPAMDSLRVNAAIYEIDEGESVRRIAELSEMLSVHEHLRHPVRKLSLGERMKCELLAALLHHPDVLFLDEPTLGLDVNAQDAIRRFLRDYNERYSATVLLTSHYMADIVALCPRVILMHQGALIYDGSLSGIVERFAPYREVDLQLPALVERSTLERYGEIASLDGLNARLIVQRAALTETVQRIFSELRPTDLSVKDPPVEQIVGRLFLDGKVSEGALPGAASGGKTVGTQKEEP